jgi:iron complex transport system permease protein
MSPRRFSPLYLLTGLAILSALMVACLFVGVSLSVSAGQSGGQLSFSLGETYDALQLYLAGEETTTGFIILNLRLPRLILGLLAGSGLAICGAIFQSLLKNPLATPYTLGMASGGTLGASIAFLAIPILPAWIGGFSVQLFALAGTLIVLGILLIIAKTTRFDLSVTLILSGVMIGTFCSAGVMMLRYLADPHLLIQIDRWTMGGLTAPGWEPIQRLLPVWAVSLVILLLQALPLNALAQGDELAQGRGVSLRRLYLLSLLGSSLMIGFIISITGPIGFVGLLVPHTIRMVVGEDHRLVLPFSVMVGGIFLVICDMVGRALMAPAEIPVGVLTALIGAPVFLAILMKHYYLARE